MGITSHALSFRTASNESGKISEFLISGVNQVSFPKMMSGFAESKIVMYEDQPSYSLMTDKS